MADKQLHRLGYLTATGIGRHRHLRFEGKDLHPGNRELHGQGKMMHGAGIVPFIEGMDQVGEEPFIQQIPFNNQTVFIRFIAVHLDRSGVDQLFFQFTPPLFGGSIPHGPVSNKRSITERFCLPSAASVAGQADSLNSSPEYIDYIVQKE